MKAGTYRLSVGLVGFLQHKTPAGCEPTHALVGFPENPLKPDHKPDHKPDQDPATEDAQPAIGRGGWTRDVTPDSRHPLVPAEVRAKIEAIEVEARAKGWPPELLWNGGFWDCPRGIAAVLDTDDEIAEVSPDYIAILKTKRYLLRFRRRAA